jgi:hypothetical protein
LNGGTVKNLAIVADDKVGLLADISYILAKSKINIESLSVDVIGGKAIISMIVSDVVKGKDVVQGAGYKVEDPNTTIVKFAEKPGELERITGMLSKEGLNVQNVNVIAKDDRMSVLGISTDKPKKAAMILRTYLITNDSAY